eukprot:TRINITY_DN11481_c0_g2_i2.p1 TRINITY_DN11481_c0_g2~~TRINITY_DN11481_c0_g2_i2.p1  ORF type:complete len:110 (+),score=9.99 TRINITY_DN11481_c0_g2_i2:510-839(+)
MVGWRNAGHNRRTVLDDSPHRLKHVILQWMALINSCVITNHDESTYTHHLSVHPHLVALPLQVFLSNSVQRCIKAWRFITDLHEKHQLLLGIAALLIFATPAVGQHHSA